MPGHARALPGRSNPAPAAAPTTAAPAVALRNSRRDHRWAYESPSLAPDVVSLVGTSERRESRSGSIATTPLPQLAGSCADCRSVSIAAATPTTHMSRPRPTDGCFEESAFATQSRNVGGTANGTGNPALLLKH